MEGKYTHIERAHKFAEFGLVKYRPDRPPKNGPVYDARL
jgi:hypothetical protein